MSTQNLQNLNETWTEVKNKVLEEWGKLAEDDLARKAKSHRQLVDLIASAYGISRTQAKREIEAFIKKHPIVSEYFDAMTTRLEQIKEKTYELARDGKKTAENSIKARPLFSLALAFITGLSLGWVVKSK